MATVDGTAQLPIDGAVAEVRRVAAEHGYALDEGASGPALLVLTKGRTLVSWGSQLTVGFAEAGPDATKVRVTTGETFALTDWGRGKRSAQKLLDAAGATLEAH